MTPAEENDYREFVAARLDPLRRTAYLLCQDWHTADDLVSITLGKLCRHWRRVRAADSPDAYARGVLTNAWLDERRRPWRRERPSTDLPEPGLVGSAGETATGHRLQLLDLLGRLPPSRRAVVRIWDGSEPASGSVKPKHPMASPRAMAGSHRCFCSSDP